MDKVNIHEKWNTFHELFKSQNRCEMNDSDIKPQGSRVNLSGSGMKTRGKCFFESSWSD